MITRQSIGYELELWENSDIDNLVDVHEDDVLVWVTGSADMSHGGHARYVIEYKGKKRFTNLTIDEDVTANQAYIKGILHAVSRITKPSRICVITAATLGFEMAFKGKGANASLMKELYSLLTEKACQLTEVRFSKGAGMIKAYINEASGSDFYQKEEKRKELEKKDHISSYKRQVYEECLAKVCKVLKANDIDEAVIEQVMEIKSFK